MKIKRKAFSILLNRVKEKGNFIQFITGPRQVGKTTMVLQLKENIGNDCKYFVSEDSITKGPSWLDSTLSNEEISADKNGNRKRVVIIDEIQKIRDWQDIVKKHYDKIKRDKCSLQMILLGSSPVLLSDGKESLAGRFESIYMSHWNYSEMREAFGWDLEDYICYGSFPGSATFTNDYRRWRSYIKESIIEATLTKDILSYERINKPALLRQLFEITQVYSGQIFSFTKMLGQLHDAGNTTTLSHYAELLKTSGLMCILSKFSCRELVKRMSIPKLQVLNNAFLDFGEGDLKKILQTNSELKGRIIESAVGGYLANRMLSGEIELYYWRDGNDEVDFVVKKEGRMFLIEVKSGGTRMYQKGLDAALKKYPKASAIIIGNSHKELEKFFLGEIV
ncbi:MAG: ATP-binding protein [bacterium]